ncbi:uncharacterized protein LOC142357466, partial [Convolutriloba macropyga]|uniref:uncharacterized protein LOC142357466 n=1 Tax=Convolutriloba macropyga TaxID=536237 RepID=UPI003F52639D
SLWIALRKPLYAPIPYELLLNSTMRTEIDINFKHRDGGNFYPNSFEAFLDSSEGQKLRKKIEQILEDQRAAEEEREGQNDMDRVAGIGRRVARRETGTTVVRGEQDGYSAVQSAGTLGKKRNCSALLDCNSGQWGKSSKIFHCSPVLHKNS